MSAVPICSTVCGGAGGAGGVAGATLGHVALPFGETDVMVLGAPGVFQPILSAEFEPSETLLRLTDLGDGRLQYVGAGAAPVLISAQALLSYNNGSPVLDILVLLGIGINGVTIPNVSAVADPANNPSTSVRATAVLSPGDIIDVRIATAGGSPGAIIDIGQATLAVSS